MEKSADITVITYAVMGVRRQVKAFMAAAGVVTVIVLTQVNTASILSVTFVVVCTFINTYIVQLLLYLLFAIVRLIVASSHTY